MNRNKIAYFLWALTHFATNDISCPSCGSNRSRVVYRKMLVTALYECSECNLRFRVPKDDVDNAIDFYQEDYKQGFTTDYPSLPELEKLVQTKFRGSQKDYAQYINILKAVGLTEGKSILDFGCSWGYGSWQLADVGFRVFSYEVSKPRADYAEQNLSCHIINSVSNLPEKVDCFFSAHVIEHLPSLDIFWDAAINALKPGGIVVCFMPNGEPELEVKYGQKRYHQLWGQVHPLLFNRNALVFSAKKFGFIPYIFSTPYNFDEIGRLNEDIRPLGEELLLIAVHQ